ncbi:MULTISPECIES: hypothetical protein [unclassified Endozoicomonas]|uniref:hypothetical protein n=1 Tax=unclassified Endozoicomonas TaxID=2644528 RepID=UPI003BB60C70
MAEQLGFTIRERNIRPLDFILSLIDAFSGDGNCDTQADLRRKFNELTGLNVSYRSWANQAKKEARLLLSCGYGCSVWKYFPANSWRLMRPPECRPVHFQSLSTF